MMSMKTLFTLFVLLFPLLCAAQQQRQISGKVVDDRDGSPLVGATVFIDPSQTEFKDYMPQGTITAPDGSFTLIIPSAIKNVVVSFMGFETLTAEISDRSSYIFRLHAAEAVSIKEIVVTGYQQIEKRKLTSSVATIDMQEINQSGAASIDQMLAGQVAGVFAMPTTGAPGAGTKMQIRSNVTLNGNSDPLWVLDGMPLAGNEIPSNWNSNDGIGVLYNMSIAGLNPEDIADITILKDAAATAIYGARAANGVIVVTTKKGVRNMPVRVNASASVFVASRPDFDRLKMMNASQKVDFELSLAANGRHDYLSGWGEVARILDKNGERDALMNGGFNSLTPATQNEINSLRTTGTDWMKELFRPTINQQYSLSLSGGGDKVTYYVSGGFYDEQGTTRQTGFQRLNMTMKTDWQIVDNLKLGVSLFVNQNKQQSFILDNFSFMSPLKYSRNVNPYLNAYDKNGNYVYDPDMAAGTSEDTTLDYNYFEELANTSYEMTTRSVKPIFELEYKPLEGLRLYTQFGLQYDSSKSEKEADKNSYYVRWYESKSRVNQVAYLPEGGVIENTVNDISQYTWKTQAEYSRVFRLRHEIDLMAGLELREDSDEKINTKGFGYNSKTLRTVPINFPDTDNGNQLAASALFSPYQKFFYKNRYVSYYMTGSYTYDNRYTFFGSLRYDGTNLFGVDRKYKYTPLWSVSGMWNIRGERFMRDQDVISRMRLRGSYGVQGNVDRNTSPYIVGSWKTASIGGVTEDRINVSSPPNGNLRWETTGMWNTALEMGFLNERLGFVFEVYGTKSKNLITLRSIPLENGFPSTMTNFGEVKTNGIELTLRSVNVKNANFTWETNFNISHNTDKVKRINIDENSWFPSREGHSVNSVFVIKTAGLDEKGLPMFWKDGEKVTLKDFVNFRLASDGWGGHNTAIDQDANSIRNWFTNIGSRDPKFTGGFTNNFRYKAFDLTIVTNFVINRIVTETPFYNPAAVNPGNNYTTAMNDVWSESNTSGIYPVITGFLKPDGTSWGGQWDPSDVDDLRMWNDILNSAVGDTLWNNLDIWTKKMSYLRVSSIRLGYTLPENLVRKMRLNSVRFNFEVRNPFVFSSNYDRYLDPETYGNIYAQPMAKTFSFGVNISF